MLQKLKANSSESLGLKFRELRKSIEWKFIRSEYYNYLKSLSDQLKENLKRFGLFYSIKAKSLKGSRMSAFTKELQIANVPSQYGA